MAVRVHTDDGGGDFWENDGSGISTEGGPQTIAGKIVAQQEAQKQWRDKQRAKQEQYKVYEPGVELATESGSEPLREEVSDGEAPPPDGVVVNVKDIPPQRPPTLRERLGIGQKKSAETKADTATKVKSDNLIVTLGPTLLATLIITFARDRIPVEYQPCAPTRAEAEAVLKPLMDMLGDQLEIAVGGGRNAINLTNAFIAMLAYGVRAYVDYVNIKKGYVQYVTQPQVQRTDNSGQVQTGSDAAAAIYKAGVAQQIINRDTTAVDSQPTVIPGWGAITSESGEQTRPGDNTLAGGMRSYKDAAAGLNTNTAGGNVGRPRSQPDGGVNGSTNTNDDTAVRDAEASLVANLLKRDSAGRRQRGLG